MYSVNTLKKTSQRRLVTLFLLFAGAFCCLAISGCGYFFQYQHRATWTAAKDIVPPSAHEVVDLYGLLMGYASDETANSDETEKFEMNLRQCKPTSPETSAACVYLRKKYLDAIVEFNKKYLADSDKYKKIRNHVQDRLIAASNQRCSAFTANIAQSRSNFEFGLGMAATLTGAAGAIVSGAAAKTYSGTSAALSGTRAEFEQSYFNNLLIHNIVIGIDQRREEMLEEIYAKREKMDPADYTVDRAIADALNYHGTCNIVTGAMENADRITRVNNPGIKEFEQMYQKLAVIRAQGFGVDKEKAKNFLEVVDTHNADPANSDKLIELDPALRKFLEAIAN